MRYICDGVVGNDDAQAALANLRACLQLLAASPQDQVAHYVLPEFPLKAEEMALDYGHAVVSVREMTNLSNKQSEPLAALDQHIAEMSGEHNGDFWTDQALFTDQRWDAVRAMAKAALSSFGWPNVVPPKQRYVEIP